MFDFQAIDEYVVQELEQMEKESDIDDILSYRSTAEQELQVWLSLLCRVADLLWPVEMLINSVGFFLLLKAYGYFFLTLGRFDLVILVY